MCEQLTELREVKLAQLEMAAVMVRIAGTSEAAAAGVVELLRVQRVADLAPALIERLVDAVQADDGAAGLPLLASALDDISYCIATALAAVETGYSHGAEQADALKRRFIKRIEAI